MQKNQILLFASFGTMIVGATAFLVQPTIKSGAVFGVGTAGSLATVILTKRQKNNLDEQNLKLQKILITLEKIEHLLKLNNPELPVLKRQIGQSKDNSLSSVKETINLEVDVSFAETPEINSEVINWLETANIKVRDYHRQQNVDSIYDKIAVFLGKRYEILKLLYKEIKRNQELGKQFTFPLSGKNEKEHNDCLQFCQILSDHSFLEFHYVRLPQKFIRATPQNKGEIMNFFNGGWFERFIYQEVCDLLSSNNLTYQCLLNTKGNFIDGNDFELDLFFLVDNQPLWIECKSGKDYNAYLSKYESYRKKLGICKERSFLIILDLTDNQTVDYTNIWSITVANRNNFLNLISTTLGLVNYPEKQTQLNHQSITISPGKLATFLKKKSQRPLIEYRQLVLINLIEICAKLKTAIPLSKIEQRLAETINVSQKLSKSNIHDILTAVMRSECLIGEDQEIVRSFTIPILGLISLEVEVIENKCIESYAYEVLKADINYFDNPDNVEEFETTVGAIVPKEKIIAQIKTKILNADSNHG